MANSSDIHRREEGRGRSWKDYVPLMVLLTLTLLAATARQLSNGLIEPMPWMHDFMGLFLVVFSMFKFFDLEGFADGFHMYDLLAKRVRSYGYIYPFLELALGLAYLARWNPEVVYPATVILMLFGSAGVFVALRKGLDLECACMGTVKFQVPAGKVTTLSYDYAFMDERGNVREPPHELPDGIDDIDASARMALILAEGGKNVADPRIPADMLTAADFRVMPSLPNWYGAEINRLQPISGVLAYDRGEAIDLKAQAAGSAAQ